jgi:uroporphyrin-III C-methyltransferase/precorrin-2 dehydrogenase/sirohydrochlorin ferrochelatase
MGLTGLPIICRELIAHGLSADMPIALVENATRDNQKALTGTLTNIGENPLTETIKPPTLIIVGTVVSLHTQLNWFMPNTKQRAC